MKRLVEHQVFEVRVRRFRVGRRRGRTVFSASARASRSLAAALAATIAASLAASRVGAIATNPGSSVNTRAPWQNRLHPIAGSSTTWSYPYATSSQPSTPPPRRRRAKNAATDQTTTRRSDPTPTRDDPRGGSRGSRATCVRFGTRASLEFPPSRGRRTAARANRADATSPATTRTRGSKRQTRDPGCEKKRAPSPSPSPSERHQHDPRASPASPRARPGPRIRRGARRRDHGSAPGSPSPDRR